MTVGSPDSERTAVVTVEAVEADGGDGLAGFTASVVLLAIALAVIVTRRR